MQASEPEALAGLFSAFAGRLQFAFLAATGLFILTSKVWFFGPGFFTIEIVDRFNRLLFAQ